MSLMEINKMKEFLISLELTRKIQFFPKAIPSVLDFQTSYIFTLFADMPVCWFIPSLL